jgi:hypothetical protein
MLMHASMAIYNPLCEDPNAHTEMQQNGDYGLIGFIQLEIMEL